MEIFRRSFDYDNPANIISLAEEVCQFRLRKETIGFEFFGPVCID